MRTVISLLFLLLSSISWAQNQDGSSPSPIVFIYDASGSMWGQMEGKTKISIAEEVLSTTVEGLDDARPLGLVAYGHRVKGDCEDVETILTPRANNRDPIKNALSQIRPLGRTPLAKSALQVLQYLIDNSLAATVILITDGVESCGGDLCEVVRTARENGLEFKMHIVGFGLSGENLDGLKCAASAGQGQYYDASSAEELSSVLDDAIAQDVTKPNDNVAVFVQKNNGPIDAWVRAYDINSGEEVGGGRSYGETAYFHLPVGVYDLQVKPLEGSDVPAQVITSVPVVETDTVFRSISFDAGTIEVMTYMNDEPCDATVRIRFPNSGKQASGGRTYARMQDNDVLPGVYNVELNALKIEGKSTFHLIENVRVKGNDTTRLEHRFKAGFALIGARSAEGLVDATVHIKDAQDGSLAAGGRTYTSESSNPKRFILTPGEYKVKLTGLGKAKGSKTSFDMTIKANQTFEKIVQF